jgi:hypothetical protein
MSGGDGKEPGLGSIHINGTHAFLLHMQVSVVLL